MSEPENKSTNGTPVEMPCEQRAIDKWRHKRPLNPPVALVLTAGVPVTQTPPPPPPLWHYTTFDALERITHKGVLWASRIQFLNDAKELQHAWDVITSAVVIRLHGLRITFRVEDERSIRNVLEQARMISKCVACFSKSRDQLSQWRAYGVGAPAAISIGFDPTVLGEKASSLDHGWKLESCLYLAADKESAVAPIVEAIVQAWPAPEVEGADRRQAIHDAVVKVWDEILHIAPRLKHEGFAEEAEVRLVSMPIVDNALWKFRRAASLVVPYVEFPLTSTGTPWSSIREILIGPNPHHKALESAVQHLCTVRGINAIVRTSSIPYR